MSGAAAAVAIGGTNFTPITRDYTAGIAASEVIPTGASQMIIGDWGGGAGGGHGTGSGCSIDNGGSGGGGAYCEQTYALTSADWGKTLTYTVAVAVGADTDGANTTVVNNTFATTVNHNAHGGGKGTINEGPGGGGLATGATTNTNGAAGTGTAFLPGGSGIIGLNGGQYGTGGNASGFGAGSPGGAGTVGHVTFKYT